MRVGYEWVHSLIDDHSRLAYCELHRDERAVTVTATRAPPVPSSSRRGDFPEREGSRPFSP